MCGDLQESMKTLPQDPARLAKLKNLVALMIPEVEHKQVVDDTLTKVVDALKAVLPHYDTHKPDIIKSLYHLLRFLKQFDYLPGAFDTFPALTELLDPGWCRLD